MAMKVTILVPNYKTLELTKLCLRLLRKYTSNSLAKVIVIDNDSNDASLEYLRSVSWVQLIERKAIPGESPALSHSRALDLALTEVDTPFVLSIHTDTLVKRLDWLPFLLQQIERDEQLAGVGSWKLEIKPWYKEWLKSFERVLQASYYRLRGKTEHALEGQGKNYYYLRSHCALYRMEPIRRLGLSFADNEEVAGKVMHRKLLEQGYQMRFLPSEILNRYLNHINHATMILNPELGSRQRTIDKGLKRIQRQLQLLQAETILGDSSLDH
jgi:GT2 family glycosyltransferase